MRKIVAVLALAFGGLGFAALPAGASTGQTYYETDTSVQFIPACTPGPANPTCDPRGPGSILSTSGTLSYTQGGATVGTISTSCTTTNKTGSDYYAVCTDTLSTPGGTITAVGYVDESALERYVPQNLSVAGPPGGVLTVQQVVYPNVFRLTLS